MFIFWEKPAFHLFSLKHWGCLCSHCHCRCSEIVIFLFRLHDWSLESLMNEVSSLHYNLIDLSLASQLESPEYAIHLLLGKTKRGDWKAVTLWDFWLVPFIALNCVLGKCKLITESFSFSVWLILWKEDGLHSSQLSRANVHRRMPAHRMLGPIKWKEFSGRIPFITHDIYTMFLQQDCIVLYVLETCSSNLS